MNPSTEIDLISIPQKLRLEHLIAILRLATGDAEADKRIEYGIFSFPVLELGFELLRLTQQDFQDGQRRKLKIEECA